MPLPERWADTLARQALPLSLLLPLVFCVGCGTTRTAGVEQRMIQPEGTARMEMAANQAFVFPVAREAAAPVFPPGLAIRELPPTTLCVSFVIDGEGTARQVKALGQEGCAVPERYPELAAASQAAVSAWRFEPALFCTYPDEATRNRDWTGDGCAGAVAQVQAVPVTLAWAFTFEVREGRARVEAARAPQDR